MKTQLMMITPKLAKSWLEANTDNRPLRPGVVDGFMEAYQRGEWKITHQGIAFMKSGRLGDGQHRLTFISQLPEGTQVPMNVTTDMGDDTFDAIDIGFKRTMSDVYRVSGDLVAVGRFFAKIANSSSTQGLTNQSTKPFIDWVTPEYEELLMFCPTHRKVWGSAAVRSAAVYQMKIGSDADFVKIAYHALVHADVASMPYAAQALMNQHMSGKIVSARSNDLFCRAVRAFDSKNNRRIASIIVTDMAGKLEEVRKFINSEMKKGPVKAGQMVAKPSPKFNWKKVA